MHKIGEHENGHNQEAAFPSYVSEIYLHLFSVAFPPRIRI